MDGLMEVLPLLAPIIVIELVLALTALVHVIKHPNYRFGNRVMWILVVLLVQIIGPVVYFIAGRGENE